MKILHTVEFYYPSLGGAQEVVRRLSEELVKKGHKVTVATSKLASRKSLIYNGVKIVEFDLSGNLVKGIRGNVDEYQQFILNNNFDLIMCYAAQQWTFDALTPILDKIKFSKVFVPCGFSSLYSKQYEQYYSFMPIWLASFNKLIFMSKDYQDINFTRKNNITNYTIIPNGASEKEFNTNRINFRLKYSISDDYFLFLSVGGHTGQKGHHLMMKAFSKANINNSILLIIGNKPFSLGCKPECIIFSKLFNIKWNNYSRKKRIILLNPPREDVVAAFKTAQTFIFASNIECSPIVLYEAMAAGIPFITTDVGNSKEIISWSKGGILVKTNKYNNGYSYASETDLITKIEYIFYDEANRKLLGNNGYTAWKNNFTFEKIFDQYEKVYQTLIS